MQLLEYRAKNILNNYKINTPDGRLVNDSSDFSGQAILKVQVPTGKRGKAGGVVKVTTQDEFNSELTRLTSLVIDGFKTEAILAEDLLSFDKEHYLSLLIDKYSGEILLVAREEGGMEVEESDGAVFSEVIRKESAEFIADKLRKFYGYGEELAEQFRDFVKKLLTAFTGSDALLIEINPLVVSSGRLVALDCKMEIDDNALYRQAEFSKEKTDANFVLLDENGDTAVIANGAGLAMATVDQVNGAGLKAANFLDIGGGANTEAITRQFARLSKLPNLKSIVVNIFAGITQCDQVAAAIVSARDNIKDLPPVYVRLHGNKYDEAKIILDNAGLGLYGSLKECIEAARV